MSYACVTEQQQRAFVICIIQENKKFCKLKKRDYRDGVKSEETAADSWASGRVSVIKIIIIYNENWMYVSDARTPMPSLYTKARYTHAIPIYKGTAWVSFFKCM